MILRPTARWWLPVAILLAIAGAVLLVGSRERPWGDGRIMYEVAESLIYRETIAVPSEWPPMSHRGADGDVYSQYGLLPSVVQLPGVLLRRELERGSPDQARLGLVVTSHLSSALLAALTCLAFFLACRRLGIRPAVASASTLALAFSTLLLIYARSPFSESLQAATFMALVAEVLAARPVLSPGRALWLGIVAASVLNAKLVFAPAVALGVGYVAWLHRARGKAALRAALFFATGFVPLLGLLLWYNHARWGSPFDTGYGETLGLLKESALTGLWGLLLSPGKSFFLYSPPCVAALFGLPALARKVGRGKALVLGAMVLWPLLFYSKFLSWSGDYAWGPRYLVYAIAPLMLGFAMWLDGVRRRRTQVVAALVVGCGLFVQLLGASFYWDSYIRISMRARAEWLGEPNRGGAVIDEKGRGHCDSCFEDMHGQQWLPPLSPVAGHLWLLRHIPADHDYATAVADAPWARYTSLSLHRPKRVYDATRIDWWGYVFLKDAPGSRGLGWSLLALFAVMTALGAAMWVLGLRRQPPTTLAAGP